MIKEYIGNIRGPKGEDGEPGPAGPNTVPTDEAIAAAVTTDGSATKQALSGTIGTAIAARKLVGIDGVIAKLDMRASETVVVASCGDSTADSGSEWFALSWRELFAELWKERLVNYVAWSKPAGQYIAPVEWQDGSSEAVVGGNQIMAIAHDTFSTDLTELLGSYPESGSGSAWTGTAAAFPVASGEVIYAYAGAGIPLAYVVPKTRVGTDGEWHYRGVKLSTTNGASKQTTFYGPYLTSQNGVQVKAVGSSALTITLQKIIGGTTTTLATFPAGTIPVSTALITFDVSIIVVGTTVTATVNGQTVTAELTSAELTAITGPGRVGFASNDPSFKLSEVEAIGTVYVESSDSKPTALPPVTVYNPAVAGSTAAWHLPNLAAAYPVRPDVLFFGHGHNYIAAVTVPQFLAAVQGFMDAFHALYPGVPIVVMSENPRFAPADRIVEQQQRQAALRAYALQQGWGYIATYEALAALPDGGQSRISDDGIHPNEAGSRVQADKVKDYIEAASARIA